ncbi:MAG: hypothetical protein H6872_05700 [Methylobacteriaceae bacterium]|nr:hypothetical protein [Methylobacteriaceae bacterium]
MVELTLVLALAAIVVIVGMRAYSDARENSRIQQLITEIGQVRAAVASRYEMGGSFENLNASVIATSMPKSLVTSDGSAIIDPYGGQVAVEAAPASSSGSGPALTCTQICGNVPYPAKTFCLQQCNGGQHSGGSSSVPSLGKYVISPGNLNANACFRVASGDYGRGQAAVQVNGGTTRSYPVSAADAQADCSEAQNTVVIGFN